MTILGTDPSGLPTDLPFCPSLFVAPIVRFQDLSLEFPHPSLPRPDKDGAATRVDAICNYRHDSMGHGLDRERLYWELNQLTHGVTQMGPYTLVKDSLFVNGE